MSRSLQTSGLCIATLVALSLNVSDAAETVTFGSSVEPFIQEFCVDCHGAEEPEGSLSLHNLDANMSDKSTSGAWQKVFTQLILRQMPPEGAEHPSESGRLRVAGWIEAQFRQAGLQIDNKLHRPGYGNHVPHDQLFGDNAVGPSFSPPRVWRIRPAVYNSGLQGVAKGTYVKPFNLKSSGHGFRDYDNQYVIAGADLNQLMANTKRAAAMLTEVKVDKTKTSRGTRTPQQLFELIQPGSDPPTDEKLQAAVDWMYHRVLLRDPTEEESSRLLAFARKSMDSDGRELGVRNMVSAVLLNPESLYRSEAGAGEPDEHGRTMLAPRELAYAIAYALTDARPDDELLKAADDGQLSTRDEVRAHVERLLNNDRVEKPRILGFFREYFEYAGAIDVFKDANLFPSHNPEVLVHDTDQLVMHSYEQDKDVFRELLTTRKSFVQFATEKGEPRKSSSKGIGVHLSYNLPIDWKWIPDQPIELPGRQRAGILTQPAWLVAKSGNFDNDAIRRGVWIRNKLLGGTILDVPITVAAQLPNDDTLTLRERMKVTEDAYCWKCHQQTNPVGLPFEMFDHFGRWRTKELGKPVVISGAINRSGDSRLDSDVTDAIDLIHKLANSDRVRQVFVRHAFRYWMGRNETLNDAATLRRADNDYTKSGGSMKTLIASLLTSDSFLYRKGIQ